MRYTISMGNTTRRLQAIKTNEKFEKLTVLQGLTSIRKKCMVLVECECKTKFSVQWASLISGNTKSCGCTRNIKLREALKNKTLYGMVSIVKEVASPKRGKRVLCRCECGKEWITRFDSLMSGATTSCGCESRILIRGTKLKREPLKLGKRYGKLVVLNEVETAYRERRVVLTQCDCGTRHTVLIGSLRDKKTRSCGCSNESQPENELYNFISDLIGKDKIFRKDREILKGKELDLYLPSFNLAIEFNGLIWHSERFQQNRNYHLEKSEGCKAQGIRLLHVWEDDWTFKKEQVKSKIKALLKLNKECIFARKTKVGSISKKEKVRFLDTYHIQGTCSSTIDLGLFLQNKLIGAMSFVKKKDKHYELVRFASSIRIVGGFSKLLVYFQRHYDWEKLVSFADLTLSDGNLYKKTGWELDKMLLPDYKYVIKGRRYHKFGFRHKLLKTKLKNYDPSKTEYQNMTDHNFYRIYDCGKLRFKIER